jgi:S-adenosylmethionine:tRNA ribosyltransferase-isomerase
MNLNKFSYDLPDELIAQHPLKEREQARLMVINREKGEILHDVFANVGNYLPKKSQIILNNSKVIPARLIGKRTSTGGKVEIFLLEAVEDCYEVLMRPMKRLKDGDQIAFDGVNLIAEIVNKEKRLVRFNKKNIMPDVEKIGHMPLPPYIKRIDNKNDREDYQTVFAKRRGSVAAPTAGLHFSKNLLGNLQSKGFGLNEVTLHVNYGTFKSVEVNDIRTHKMHYEYYKMTKSVHEKILKSKKNNQKIVAVGTTSMRTLESIGKTNCLEDRTNIFIYPGFRFTIADILITNFHLPKTTLLMLVYAFGGDVLIRKAYQEAIKEKYRFFSYGDAMIII